MIDFVQGARVPRPHSRWKHGAMNARTVSTRHGEVPDIVQLSHHCLAGLHLIEDDGFGGYVVMEDSPREIRRHMPIFVAGSGKILVTGLGLGCVVRGLLLKRCVSQIDVLEINEGIIEHVAPEFSNDNRVRIHQADALAADIDGSWDFAWHDIYCDGDDGLQNLHAALIKKWHAQVPRQGAWGFPSCVREFYPQLLCA